MNKEHNLKIWRFEFTWLGTLDNDDIKFLGFFHFYHHSKWWTYMRIYKFMIEYDKEFAKYD